MIPRFISIPKLTRSLGAGMALAVTLTATTRGQAPFSVGLNEPYTDGVFQEVLKNPSTTLSSDLPARRLAFKFYNIDHHRYPGGTCSRVYFHDDAITNYSTAANTLLNSYYGSSDNPNQPPASDMENFLRFTSADPNALSTPVIVLNTFFYASGGVVRQLEPFVDRYDDSITAAVQQLGKPDRAEIQTIGITPPPPPQGAYFRLAYNGETSAPIAAGATSATVQTSLNALSTLIGANVAVTGTYTGGYTVTFPVGPNRAKIVGGQYAHSGALSVVGQRWVDGTIKTALESEIDFVHQKLVAQGADRTVIWELGNETYSLLSAASYAQIVTKYVGWIHAKAPNDKMIVSISKGGLQHAASDGAGEDGIDAFNVDNHNWMVTFLSAVPQTTLDMVHYFAPHNYHDTKFSTTDAASISAKVRDDFFQRVCNEISAYFTAAGRTYTSSSPKLFGTEFAVLLPDGESISHCHTKCHALLMWDTMLKYRANAHFAGMSKQTGCSPKNALFYLKYTDGHNDVPFSPPYLPYLSGANAFVYTPPDAEAAKVFAATQGVALDAVYPANTTDTLEWVRTSTAPRTYFQVLNYGSTHITWTLPMTGTWSSVQYSLCPGVNQGGLEAELKNHNWSPASTVISGSSFQTMNLPAYSFTTVTF